MIATRIHEQRPKAGACRGADAIVPELQIRVHAGVNLDGGPQRLFHLRRRPAGMGGRAGRKRVEGAAGGEEQQGEK